ncbi:hypothetical protein BZA77DRAFT_386605 [Pyronema omphalodes]|nr:hypothetical protein BZA77DRAFT_386605 [Pyronema omphalodes]
MVGGYFPGNIYRTASPAARNLTRADFFKNSKKVQDRLHKVHLERVACSIFCKGDGWKVRVVSVGIPEVKEKNKVGKMKEGKMKVGKMKEGKVKGEKMKGEKMKGEKMKGEKMKGEKMKGEKMKGEKMKGGKMKGGEMKVSGRKQERMVRGWKDEDKGGLMVGGCQVL